MHVGHAVQLLAHRDGIPNRNRIADQQHPRQIRIVLDRGNVAAAYYAGYGPAEEIDPAEFERPTIGRRQSNWQRLSARMGQSAEPAIETHEHAPGTLDVGTRVFHQKFGYGLIEKVDGNKLQIAFDKAGTKKVMDSFVTPA